MTKDDEEVVITPPKKRARKTTPKKGNSPTPTKKNVEAVQEEMNVTTDTIDTIDTLNTSVETSILHGFNTIIDAAAEESLTQHQPLPPDESQDESLAVALEATQEESKEDADKPRPALS